MSLTNPINDVGTIGHADGRLLGKTDVYTNAILFQLPEISGEGSNQVFMCPLFYELNWEKAHFSYLVLCVHVYYIIKCWGTYVYPGVCMEARGQS